MTQIKQKRYKIAIIGSGIAGCTAAYYLNKKHDITIYEKNNYIGGHVNTIDVQEESKIIPIDTGFIVFNDKTYPSFISLLDEIGQKYHNSVMSFSVTNKKKNIEYNGSSINGLFSQRRNIFSLSFQRMIRDIIRFNKNKNNPLSMLGSISLKQFLIEGGYSDEFTYDYLIPMASSIWSAEQSKILEMPIKFLINFFNNHGLLQLKDRPQWMVISGGSKEYIKKLSHPFKDRIQLNSRIECIERNNDGVVVKSRDHSAVNYDYIFIATHSDQAIQMLGDISNSEQEVLSAIKYQINTAVLHTDKSAMPSRERAWAAWNYRQNESDSNSVNVTYSMNILQTLDSEIQYFVTLNNTDQINPRKIIRTIKYEHPIFDENAIKAQARHEEINKDPNRTFFCGAYWSNGFHEDGVVSARNALNHFEGSL